MKGGGRGCPVSNKNFGFVNKKLFGSQQGAILEAYWANLREWPIGGKPVGRLDHSAEGKGTRGMVGLLHLIKDARFKMGAAESWMAARLSPDRKMEVWVLAAVKFDDG
jgi:hypothetical protein